MIITHFTGNRPHPSDGRSLFADGDPRDQFVVSNVDPRIHFALVCGAKVSFLQSIFFFFNSGKKFILNKVFFSDNLVNRHFLYKTVPAYLAPEKKLFSTIISNNLRRGIRY